MPGLYLQKNFKQYPPSQPSHLLHHQHEQHKAGQNPAKINKNRIQPSCWPFQFVFITTVHATINAFSKIHIPPLFDCLSAVPLVFLVLVYLARLCGI